MKKQLKQLVIVFGDNNPIVSEAVQKILFKAGYRWPNGDKDVASTQSGALFTYGDGSITHSKQSYARTDYRFHEQSVDLTKEPITNLIALLNIAPVTVKLNDSYTAEITETDVKVGCQTFPHSKVLELAEAIKNRKN